MPIGFLTAAERERLSRFPEHIPEDDLSVFFLLSEADHQAGSCTPSLLLIPST
jgi:hypothetical protein